jgi:hypothetical protein
MLLKERVDIIEASRKELDAACVRLLNAPEPDQRVMRGYRSGTALRRTAKRLRVGVIRSNIPDLTSEELAQKYDYAAEYNGMMAEVRRLIRENRSIEQYMAVETLAEVRTVFHRSKAWAKENPEPSLVANVNALHRELRRDLGRPGRRKAGTDKGALRSTS